MTSPVLGYWKIRGVGQPILHLLNYMEVDYEEVNYEFTETGGKELWLAAREKLGLPLANLPYLLDGPHKVTESRAIMRYLCKTRRPELLGKTLNVQTRVDMVDYFIYDLMEVGLVPVVYGYTDELHKQFKESFEPLKLGFLQEFLGDNKFIAADDVTFVDFNVYEVLYHLKAYDSKCLDSFPKLQDYMKRIEELPQIKRFMGTKDYLKGPCYLPIAKIKI